MGKLRLFIGTYTEPVTEANGNVLQSRGKGIYTAELDLESGKFSDLHLQAECPSPSFLAFSKDKQTLYAALELAQFQDEEGGGIAAFAITDQGLQALNEKPTHGAHPCHVYTSADGLSVVASNYSGGNFMLYKLAEDGSLGDAAQFVQHQGSSVNPVRQKAPYLHSCGISNDNRYLYAADLGTDRLVCYRYHPDSDQPLHEQRSSTYNSKPGSGPRHFIFSADGRFAYLLNELNHSLDVLAYGAEDGSLKLLQSVSTLPNDASGEGNTCADLHLTPDGRLLYASNRGHDSLAAYAVDQSSGLLETLSIQTSGGKVPRSFLIEPAGHYLVVANQESDNLVSYLIGDEGSLTEVDRMEVGSPVCVKYLA